MYAASDVVPSSVTTAVEMEQENAQKHRLRRTKTRHRQRNGKKFQFMRQL
jgi:hypothetical protein